ncbi:MAG: class I SAM-dependent methyltransferase [Deltaproteobacteria bacterium]
MQHIILATNPSRDYELLDSGEGEKLERYGGFAISRPDPQVLWRKRLSTAKWSAADALFTRDERNAQWKFTRPDLPRKWEIELGGLRFWIKPTPFKHVGVFPEHLENWLWMRNEIKRAGRKISMLNVFGYTAGASLAAAAEGAEVCHVEGSKPALAWARENAQLSGLEAKPVRWILDDAPTFVRREIKRGKKYDAIVVDPPAFGHGPAGELWKIEENFLPFLDSCRQVLSDTPLFILINGYASGYSAIAYRNNLGDLTADFGGKIEAGELAIRESGRGGRLLPAGIFARWSARASAVG